MAEPRIEVIVRRFECGCVVARPTPPRYLDDRLPEVCPVCNRPPLAGGDTRYTVLPTRKGKGAGDQAMGGKPGGTHTLGEGTA